jgi:S1-C subfamily serine protease
MSEEKNTQKPEAPEERESKFSFLRESIKKPEPDKRKRIKKAGMLLGSALVFGVVAALAFAFVYPRVAYVMAPPSLQNSRDLQDNHASGIKGSVDGIPESSPTSAASVAAEVSSAARTGLPDGNKQEPGTISDGSGTQGAAGSQESDVSEKGKGTQDQPEGSASPGLPETGRQETRNSEQEGSRAAEENSNSSVPELTLESMELLTNQMQQVAEEARHAVVTVIGITQDLDWFNETYENQGQLSGLIVSGGSKEYFILTEYRVVKDVDRIMVTFFNGDTVDARYVRRDDATGLAVLRVMAEDVGRKTREEIQVADVGWVQPVSQGQLVMAVGSPMGYSDAFTWGIVTSVNNSISVTDNVYRVITTNMQAGEDGSGVLLNMDGQVIGFMAQKLTDTKALGLVSCLPMAELYTLVQSLCANEEQVYAGVSGQEVVASISEKTGIPKGVWVDRVETDSPAMKAGIQKGDVIYKVDETDISSLRDFHTALENSGVGKKVQISVMRQSVEGYVEIVFDVVIDAV